MRLIKNYYKIFLLVFVYSFGVINGTFAQAVGDYGSTSNGNWGTVATWSTWNGASWVAAGSIPSTTTNVFILTGFTVVLNSTGPWSCKSLTVQSGAKLWCGPAAVQNIYISVWNGDILDNGIIGNGATFDYISFNIEAPNCLISGTGTFDASRIRKNNTTNPITNLTISMYVSLRFGAASQTQIYNACASTFNINISATGTLDLTTNGILVGNASMDGVGGADVQECAGSYTVDGLLKISGIFYLTTNNVTSPCSVTINPTGIVQTANVLAGPSGAATNSLTMLPGGLLQITGTPFTNPFTLVNNIYTLNPGSTIEYSAPGIQTVDSNLTYANLKISGSGNKTGAGPIDVLGNFTITNATGAAVFVPYPPNPILNVGGNWTNYGTAGFNDLGSFVTLNGGGNQTITVTAGGEDFSTLKINKSGGKVYNSAAPATITRIITTLDLTLGNYVTSIISGNYYVQIQNAATVINVSDNSFVEGTCGRQLSNGVPVNFTFPIGKIAKYRPDAIAGTPTSSFIILSEYYKVDPDPVVGSHLALGPGLDHVSRCEYWRIRTLGNPAVQNFTVTLSWDTYSCGVSLLSDIRVASWGTPTANLWNNMGNSATTGNTSVGTVTESVISAFSSSTTGTPFTLSSVSIENVLPINLVYFNAKTYEDKVLLSWTTSSEINNDYFTLERSGDGRDFREIGHIRGNGNSTEPINYQEFDNHPLSGISYYRLRQTDFDGKETTSNIVAVKFSNKDDFSIAASPVPVVDFLNLYCGSASNSITIQIIQPDGKIVKTLSSSPGSLQLNVEDLNSGVYFLRVTDQDKTKTIQIVKK